jgi:uncharacterized tellurite resistance protein B-like protein
MFNSLRHWLESLDEKDSLFDHPDAELIHVALASLLYHIISVDGEVSEKEKHQFALILENEFNLSDEQVSSLYGYVKALNSDLTTDLETINDFLKQNPHLKMLLMSKLNQLIAVDGVKDEELDIFYQATKVIFPEVAERNKTF